MLVTELDKADVEAGLANGSILIIDVREPHEFAAGRIPGSVCLPLSRFDPRTLSDAGEKRIVFSCAAGIRSLRAIEFAQAAGFGLDAHYVGGFKDWAAQGGAIER